MSSKSKRRGHGDGEHENHERWLLTYADMITLLVAFFIMLYAMSIVNTQKFEQLAVSVRSGFGSSMEEGAPTIIRRGGGGSNGTPRIVASTHQDNPNSQQGQGSMDMRALADVQDKDRLDSAYVKILQYIKANHLENKLMVQRDERGVVITVMTDKMLFAAGQADLRPDELGLLDTVGKVINTMPNDVRIEGHTDNLPIHNERFPSNWELSTTRATTVLRYFLSRGMGMGRLEAAGYADEHPIDSNTTEAGRARNRRVEIVILKMADSDSA